MLPLLAWRLDAIEHGAPGATEPAELGVLANRLFLRAGSDCCAWCRAGSAQKGAGAFALAVCCIAARLSLLPKILSS